MFTQPANLPTIRGDELQHLVDCFCEKMIELSKIIKG